MENQYNELPDEKMVAALNRMTDTVEKLKELIEAVAARLGDTNGPT